MTKRPLFTLLTALMLATAMPAAATDDFGGWTASPTLVSGTSRYQHGEWIYTDFVYDDYGADTIPAGQTNVVSLAPTSGDFRYPSGDTFSGNAADIVEVRTQLAANGGALEVRVLLQTLIDPSAVALWVRSNGDESIVTAANSTISAAENTVSFRIPGAGLDDTVSLNIGAGLNDGQGGLRKGVPGSSRVPIAEITTGGPSDSALFDLAFNTRSIEGRGGAWNEDVQSDALQAGDLSQFEQTIDIGLLASGVTVDPPAPTGYFVRLLESRQQLAEGMGGSFPQYRGKWQPYAVWVPDSYTPSSPAPLFLSLHSLSVHHNQFRGGSSPSASYATYYEQFGDGLDAVVVTPLGRGPDGWYEDEALVDTLEVWADALKNYSIDRDRILVGGYSMGGYGTYRLTTMMPDSFASAVSIVGPPVNGIWAYPLPPTGGESNPDNTRPQLENTRHIPFWITHGVADELVPVSGVVHQTQRFAELGYEYRFALHPAADHLSFVFQDDWSREASWFLGHMVRVVDPQRVTLKVRPASWATNHNPTVRSHLDALTPQLGARLDGAYWVGEVTTGTDATGFVDLSTGRISRRQVSASKLDPSFQTDGPSPYVLSGQDPSWEEAAVTDVLFGTLSKVTALTVDVGRAGLSDNPQLQITTDSPVRITFLRNGGFVGERLVIPDLVSFHP